MTIREEKMEFERHISEKVYESAKLTFCGADGWDIYNCSIPFAINGKEYIYGRMERRDEWATSWSVLFEKTGPDEYTRVPGSTAYQLEDPFISFIHGELVLGGTHVRKKSGKIDTYYGYFYKGSPLEPLTYFTTGPEEMKDIRLVQMHDGRIGVFSRPRNKQIEKEYGSVSMIGFTTIQTLEELTDQVIENAKPISGIFGKGEWGGCNQVYPLENGKLGVIGHQSYQETSNGTDLAVYLNISFEFDPHTFQVSNRKVLGTRRCYPEGPAKYPYLADCTFTSGIVLRDDGKVDLYGGLSDVGEGRIVIDYPFEAGLL